MNTTAVLIFASLKQASNKFSPCSPKTARKLFRTLTDLILSACRKTFRENVFLAIPPNEDHELEKTGVPIIQQAGDTFADRLLSSVTQVFRQGYDRILIVGNDCPQLNDRLLRQAKESFESSEILLGPDHKGGLYLIGITRETVALLSGIRWNTDTDFAEIVKACQSQNIHCAILETCTDLDNLSDLQRAMFKREVIRIPQLRGLLSSLRQPWISSCSFFSPDYLVFRTLEHVQLANQLPPPSPVGSG